MKAWENIQIVLASKSPRRKELLQQAGYDFEIITSDVEEIVASNQPEEVVKELSYQKGKAVLEQIVNVTPQGNTINPAPQNGERNPANQADTNADDQPNALLVIGADTVVVANGKILGKPKDETAAYAMIEQLQGSEHQVYTGVSLFYYDGKTLTEKSFAEKTDVSVYEMQPEEIKDYIATGDCMDKAGAYGIQGAFAVHIKGICGDYNNVVGLPIARLYQELKNL